MADPSGWVDVSATETDFHDAQAVLGTHPQFLATGATCVVFTDGQRVLRLSDPNPGKAARFQVDAQIRRRLREAGLPTPQTLEVGALPGGRTYSLDAPAFGDDSPPSRDGWADLGRALKVLHALAHTGYGLLQDRPDELHGLASTPQQGIHTRLQQVWPFDEQPLSAHPLVWAAPELAPALTELAGDLRKAIQAPTAVCHTDLHQNQFQWRGGRLAFCLDFGDASAFPPAWDIASIAYFHGWEVAALVADAAGLPCGRAVALLGVLLAFHRASRALGGHPQQKDQAVAFARACLSRAFTQQAP